MTGQNEREVGIQAIIGRYPSFDHLSAEGIIDAILAAGFHLTPTAEVKAEALEEAAKAYAYVFAVTSYKSPVYKWLRDRATHLRENGGE